MRTIPVISLSAAALMLLTAPSAAAGGSDAPTPYVVAPDGLHLPDGRVFQDSGHVNIRYTVDGTTKSAGVHFESLNGQPSGVFIGSSFLPWSYLVDAEDYCITWVQVSDFDEHFGEGGQEPVCTTAGDEGDESGGQDESGTDEGAEEGEESEEITEEDGESEEGGADEGAEEGEEPVEGGADEHAEDESLIDDATTEGDEETESSVEEADTAEATVASGGDTADAEASGELASTGVSAGTLAAFGAGALALGGALYWGARRWMHLSH